MHPHHRPSEADGIVEPVPGLLAGGPNPSMQDKCQYPSALPDEAYVDDVCSYASNEIAINWNAPLVYLAFGIEALEKVAESDQSMWERNNEIVFLGDIPKILMRKLCFILLFLTGTIGTTLVTRYARRKPSANLSKTRYYSTPRADGVKDPLRSERRVAKP